MRPIVFGQAVSLLGDYIAYFTLPFFVVTLTGSPLALGLTAAFETIPMLLFGFAAGVFLDRRPLLRRTLVLADVARAAAFLLLAAGIAADVVEVWMVLVVAFVVGSMSVVFDSGLQALLPRALTEDMYVVANSRLQLARTLAYTVGPALGGILVARSGGFEVAFLLNGATFIASGIFLTRVRELSERPPKAALSRFRRALSAGLDFLWSDLRLRWATIGGAVTNLVFAPLEAILVLFVRDRLAGNISAPAFLEWAFRDEAEIGMFLAVQALIGSIGVALAPKVARRVKLGQMFVVGLMMLGGGFFVVALSGSFLAVIPAGIALTGVSWVNVALGTLRQRLTPEPLLGRVIAASRTISWIGLPVGAALGGLLGEWLGIVPLYVSGSAAVIAVAVSLIFTPLWNDHVAATPDADAAPDGDGRPTPSDPDAEPSPDVSVHLDPEMPVASPDGAATRTPDREGNSARGIRPG